MIILFKDGESLFRGIGLGILRDARVCTVSEGLNDAFEVTLEYPITGNLYDKLQLNRIIFCKPNPYSEAQPFRISSISKPINGIVTVNAFHISYDMNGIPVKPVDGKTCKDTLDKIQNGALITHHFKLYTDKEETKGFKTTNYYNMRALLMGSSESVLEKYEGELLFDKFNVYLLKHRGSNKGAQVRYAKNLKDITHEITYDRLYNGVYPYYHQETTSQTTSTSSDGFKQVYIVGNKPYQDGWLSYEENGEPYHPIDESPVQIATEGNFNQKVYCWDTKTQRYIEKIYNETVTLIDQVGNLLGSDDTPSWIYIDWSKLPTITCKANVDGYFKAATESDWTQHKKGDIIFESSIKDAASNLILYFSEVIPATSTSETEETTEVVHVELPDKIIRLDTDAAKEMSFDRILSIDLSTEFDEAPTPEQLEAKANEYIEKNKIGQYKYNTTVTFVDLSTTTEGATYENMESIELGDTVKVVYDALGVNVDLRVITTKYNVLLDRYDKIELGESSEKISGESVQSGDNVSSLTNDVGFTDVNTVNKLIAKTVTADYIKALNAQFSKAQIEELQAARLKVSGLIEATQFELDTLVAKLLTADNAVIKETLEAGTVKVKGDISVMSGEITLENKDKQTAFRVDRDGNVTANAVKITGGELNINDTFTVTQDGILSAQGAIISGTMYIEKGTIELGTKFKVEEDGTVTASGATIEGQITADSGSIAGFTISKTIVGGVEIGRIQNGVTSIDDTSHNGVYIGTDGIRLGPNFKVDKEGNVTATGIRWEVSRTIMYNTDTQGTLPPGSGWTQNIPSVAQGAYLWSRVDILYIDNTHDYIYSATRQGEDGTSVEIAGNVTTYTALLQVTGMQDGDGYIVDDASDDASIPVGKPTDGILYIYNNNVWNYSGQIKGPQGDPGTDGADGRDGTNGTDGATPYIGADGYWYINGQSLGVKAEGVDGQDGAPGQDGADGTDGLTPFIGANGNWWIGETDTGVKAEGHDGSDADVTWANVTAVFDTSAQTTKGIYYAQDHEGNLALLLNATAGQIGSFQIYADMLQAGTSGNRVVVSPGTQRTLFSVNKYWSFLAGVTFTTSGNSETYQTAKFGVTRDGDVYASSLHITGGEISITPQSGGVYKLNDISQISVQYTLLMYNGQQDESTYPGSTHDFDPYNLRNLPLPVSINGLQAGTSVPVVDSVYDGDYYAIDKYWYVGTMIFSGIEYDAWLHVEDEGEGWNSSYQRFFLATRAVQYVAGFQVDSDGNVLATSVTILGGQLNIAGQSASFAVSDEGVLEAKGAIIHGTIYAGAGQIGGFTIGQNAIYSNFTDGTDKAKSTGVYIGTDVIRLGNDTSRTYYYPSSSGTFSAPSTLSGATLIDITDSNHKTDCYNGCKFKFTTAAYSAYDRKIRFWPCDQNGDLDLTAEVCEVDIPKQSGGGVVTAYITLKHPNPTISSGQYHAYYKAYDYNGYGFNSCRLTLDVLPGFVVDNNGHLYANSVNLTGQIYATGGSIAGFTIDSTKILKGTIGQTNSVMVSTGTSATITNLDSSAHVWCFSANNNFGVTQEGYVYAYGATLKNVNIINGNISLTTNDNIITIGSGNSSTLGLTITSSFGYYYGSIEFGGILDSVHNLKPSILTRSLSTSLHIQASDRDALGDCSYIDMYPSSLEVYSAYGRRGYIQGIQIGLLASANATYGRPLTNGVLEIFYYHKDPINNTEYGYIKDVKNTSGTFRYRDGNAMLLCTGFQNDTTWWANSYEDSCLAVYCARFVDVSEDGWKKVHKPFTSESQIKAVVTGRLDSSLGGYNYPALYKIVYEYDSYEGGSYYFVYIGNDGGKTTIDVAIIYEESY